MASVIRGLDSTKRALHKLSPELYKEMNIEIKVALRSITADAKSHVPSGITGLSNWMGYGRAHSINRSSSMFGHSFPMFNAATVKSGISFKMTSGKVNSNGFKSAYSVLNKSAAGAIMETAGRKNPHGRPKTHEVIIDKRFSRTRMQVHSTKDSSSNNPDAGAHFIEALNHGLGAIESVHVPTGMKSSDKHGGRLLYASVNRNEGKAKAAIIKAIEKATNTVNRELKI